VLACPFERGTPQWKVLQLTFQKKCGPGRFASNNKM
jgi:hypothetical protein